MTDQLLSADTSNGSVPTEKCPGDDVNNHIPVAGYDDSDHVNKTFKTTNCSGTKANYVLMKPIQVSLKNGSNGMRGWLL